MKTAGIAGAGVLGRLLALELNKRGWNVTLYDRDSERGEKKLHLDGCGHVVPLL